MSKEKYYIEILQAYNSGKIVKYRYHKSEWIKVLSGHEWNFGQNEYKVFEPRKFGIHIDTTGENILEIYMLKDGDVCPPHFIIAEEIL